MITTLVLLASIALAFLALCAAIWRALIADLPHYDNPGDVQ